MKTKKIQFLITPSRYAYYANRTYDIQADKADEFVSKKYAVYAEAKLAEDFPYRDVLMNAGLQSAEAVRAFGDLTEIKGIGKAATERINEYLEA